MSKNKNMLDNKSVKFCTMGIGAVAIASFTPAAMIPYVKKAQTA